MGDAGRAVPPGAPAPRGMAYRLVRKGHIVIGAKLVRLLRNGGGAGNAVSGGRAEEDEGRTAGTSDVRERGDEG